MSLVLDRIQEHYEYALKKFEKDNIIGIFLCGSQNYRTDIPGSDVDTKLLLTPTLSDIYLNKRAESSTMHLPNSEEQMSTKDIRAFIAETKKQNTNVLELLYTEYCMVNPLYKSIWEQLINHREEIVRYNPVLAMKAIKGNAFNMYSRLFKDSPTINKKMVANLVRYEYYINKYIEQALYENCLRPNEETLKFIHQIRCEDMGQTSLKIIAENSFNNIINNVDEFCEQNKNFKPNIEIDDLLNDICEQFIDTSFLIEYAGKGMI